VHELGLTRDIVAIVTERAGASRVKRVTLEIGALSAVMPDAIRFCFDVCAEGTPLAGAELCIREVPGAGRCRDCGAAFPMSQPFGRCGCGSRRIELTAGDELLVKEMEVC